MQSTARDNYLVTEVRTAAPQKLQLMLIEAALRLANRAALFWKENRNDRALTALLQAQSIVAEILGSMDREAAGDLAAPVSAIYEFIYRSLVHAGYRRDEKGLRDAIRILEIERDTWRKLCDKIAAESRVGIRDQAEGSVPRPRFSEAETLLPSDGFSVEA